MRLAELTTHGQCQVTCPVIRLALEIDSGGVDPLQGRSLANYRCQGGRCRYLPKSPSPPCDSGVGACPEKP